MKADNYQQYYTKVRRYLYKFASTEKKTLDLGCGDGHLIGDFKNIIGIDIDKNNVKKYPSKIIIQDLTKGIPFSDDSFEQIICLEVIEHLKEKEDVKNLLKESYRVLSNEGMMIITTPNKKRWTLLMRKIFLKDKKYPYCISEKNIGKCKEFTHMHYHEFSKEEIEKLLKEVGFRKIFIEERFLEMPFILKGIDVKSELGKMLLVVTRKVEK